MFRSISISILCVKLVTSVRLVSFSLLRCELCILTGEYEVDAESNDKYKVQCHTSPVVEDDDKS